MSLEPVRDLCLVKVFVFCSLRKLRKALSAADFKKAARKPWRKLKGVKVLGGSTATEGSGVVVLD